MPRSSSTSRRWSTKGRKAKYGAILKEIEENPVELDDWYQEGGKGVQQVVGGGNGN
jgi:hypothetical protein